MGWLRDALDRLKRGEIATVRPRGGSMRGRIEDGQEVTIAPVDPAEVQVGDAVLVRWRGCHLLHLIKKIDGRRVQIGNNVGRVNGWTDRSAIIGRVLEE